MDETKQKIMDATMELVRDKGYAATTTKDIAREAGVNECTIFRKFRGKKDIILSAMEMCIRDSMYVADLETYDLLFINKAGKDTFNFKATEGKKCYELLQGLDAPCPFCSTPKLKPEEYYNWEHTNPITGRHYLLKDRLIEWEGRPARFELAFDLTEAMRCV